MLNLNIYKSKNAQRLPNNKKSFYESHFLLLSTILNFLIQKFLSLGKNQKLE